MRALTCLVLAGCSFARPTDVTFGSAEITVVSGDGQEGIAGSALALPFAVNVVDADLEPIANFTVAFAVTTGEGMLSDAAVRTDAQGNATTTLTLDRRVGENTVDVTGEGIATDRIFFSARGLVGAPGRLVALAGDGESSVVDTELALPLVARLEDVNENVIEGGAVDFAITAGGGSLSVASALSDRDGLVEVRVTPGTIAGPNIVEARVPGIDPAVFTVIGRADVPASIAKVSGDGQLVTALVPSAPLVVSVRDQHGNLVPDAAVEWSRTAGTGTLSATTSITDAEGRATTLLTATTMLGSNAVEARAALAPTSSVAFLASTRTLRAQVQIPLNPINSSSVPTASAVADIDGDGRPDLIVARGSGTLVNRFDVLLNQTGAMDTTPSFGTAVGFTACDNNDDVTSLSAGDIDGDGDLDVVVTAGSKLVIHLNTTPVGGSPSFAAPFTFGNGLGSTHYRDHVLADLNGDTKLDAIVDVDDSPARTVLRRSTSVTTPSFAADVILDQMRGPLVAADLDDDQKIDLVGSNSTSLRMCRNTMGACTTTAIAFPSFSAFTVIDVDSDDKPDLVTSTSSGTLGLARNTTTGALSFDPPTNVVIGKSLNTLRAADINGDGKVDLVGTANSELVVVLNSTTNGVPTFTVSPFVGFSNAVRAVDLNGDGRLDLISFSTGSSVGIRLQE